MSRALAALAACSALLLAQGCGSSGSSSAGSSKAAPSTSATASTSTHSSSGLKVSTTPKYAAPEPSAPVQSGSVQIAYRNIAIAPDTLRVKVGSTLRWTNYDSVEHNVTSRTGPAHFASGNFGEGKTYQVNVTQAGVIHYLCTIHPTTMNGTIEVLQ